MAKILVLFSVKRLDIFDKMPIKEKSKIPSIRKLTKSYQLSKAFQRQKQSDKSDKQVIFRHLLPQ